jgi:hypothetical protein
MQLSKTIVFPIFVILVFVFSTTLFQGCNPDDCDDEIPSTCDTCIQLLKPNIYIYPVEEIRVNVWLTFPKGGAVTVSNPEYENGWYVTVDTTGNIDGKYDYLFYESEQPDVCQMKKGWCIKKDNLTQFFRENMSEYGFNCHEIDDFNEYWIPRFNSANYYLLYAQTNEIMDSVVKLNLSETPDNILRLFYVVKESDNSILLEAPEISVFNRTGFFVTEWGVILK